MGKLYPVSPTTPVPRSPPVHRDKRRRDSEPDFNNPDEAAPAQPEKADISDDTDHTLDEYA